MSLGEPVWNYQKIRFSTAGLNYRRLKNARATKQRWQRFTPEPTIRLRTRHRPMQTIDGTPTEMFIEVRSSDVAKIPQEKLSSDPDGKRCQVKSGALRSKQSH